MMLLKRLATHPLVVIASICAGVAAGVYLPRFSMDIAVIGTLYMALLKVVVLPFVLATVLGGVVGLLRREGASKLIGRIVIGFTLSMLLASAVGVAVATLTSPDMTVDRKASLGSLVTDEGSELRMTWAKGEGPATTQTQQPMVLRFIPDNVFAALDQGDSLKVVVFALIFGISLGSLKERGGTALQEMLRAIQLASIELFRFLNYFLPIALIAMIGSQVASMGLSVFAIMLDFVLQQIGVGALLIVAAMVVLWVRSRNRVAEVINAIRQPLIVALSSRSALVCVPFAQDALRMLRFEAANVELMVPLSFTVNRIGSIMYYAVATVFIANLYGVTLDPSGLLVIVFGSILAGMASAGTTGVLTVATVAVVCDLLKMPSEAVIFLLVAVDPVMDMIRTALQVCGNIAVAGFVCDRTAATEAAA
jgi:Na+/H+-dicarboxylate symporter